MGLHQALSFSGSDGKQTVCAVAVLLTVYLLEKWQSVGMASQADADYWACLLYTSDAADE